MCDDDLRRGQLAAVCVRQPSPVHAARAVLAAGVTARISTLVRVNTAEDGRRPQALRANVLPLTSDQTVMRAAMRILVNKVRVALH